MSENSGTNAKTIQHGQGSLDSKISALGQCAVHQDCSHHNPLLRMEDHERLTILRANDEVLKNNFTDEKK